MHLLWIPIWELPRLMLKFSALPEEDTWLTWMKEEVQPRTTLSNLCCLTLLVKVTLEDLECSGMISGGLEQLAMDPTVNTTGVTGPGIIPRLKSNGLTG